MSIKQKDGTLWLGNAALAASAAQVIDNLNESVAPFEPQTTLTTASVAQIYEAKGWLKNAKPVDPHLDWLHAQDPDCSRDKWLKILFIACAKGITKAQTQEWSAWGAKFHQTDFDAAWKGACDKLTQPHDSSAPSAPSPEQQTASAALEVQFASWPGATAEHPYLIKKNVPPKSLKIAPDGRLAVPIRDLAGGFCSVQFIDVAGVKKNALGASLGAGMFIVNTIKPSGVVYVAEGLATAWSIYNADPYGAVAVSFSVGRFAVVAKALRDQYPKVRIVLVPDRGAEPCAKKVAGAVDGAWVELPPEMPDKADAWDFEAAHSAKALGVLLKVLHAPEQDADPYARLDWTDTGSAALMAKRADGDLRYIHERKRWMHWNGECWTNDEDGSMVQGYALRVADFYFDKAAKLHDSVKDAPPDVREKAAKAAKAMEEWAERCRGKKALSAMIDLASHIPGVPISAKQLDAYPTLLGVTNGVVDLLAGTLRDAARDDFVTRRSPLAFDPAAECPKWLAFIKEITGAPILAQMDSDGKVVPGTVGVYKPRPALADYLQRLAGYCATGGIEQHKLFLFVGAGSNGKSVLLDTLRWILGDYAATCPSELLLESKAGFSGGASPDIAALAGARLALASESKENQKFALATVKRLTGGDTLTGRYLYANPVTFEPSHKLTLQTNSVPTLDHLDPAIRGRLHLIPFDRRWNRPGESDIDPTLPDGDEHLVDDLRAEGTGILAWIVRGAVAYAKSKLVPPSEVMNMTKAYFAEQDVLGKWLNQYERCDPKDGTAAKPLFEAFRSWCESEGFNVIYSKNSFSATLVARQVKKESNNKGTWYGVRLKDDDLAALAA